MPAHHRTKSSQRASSLPPSSPPLAFRQSNAARERARRTPMVPSARRKHVLEAVADTSASRHLQAALALLPANGSSKRPGSNKLGSPIQLRPSKPVVSRMTIQEEDDDEDMFIVDRPDDFSKSRDVFFSSLDARTFDWREDPFGDSPVYVHGQRPNYKHKHKRSTSYIATPSLRPPPRTLQRTLASATPSPGISAANSPVPSPLMLSSDLDFSLLLPNTSQLHGWSGARPSPGLATPAFSTPGLSPSASSISESPFVPGCGGDYSTPQTPRTPRPVPS